MGKPKEVVRMLVPRVTVSFSSGCIMILGLVASRLVARDLGSSLYTWASVLGIALMGLLVGSCLGGRIADRYHARRALAVLFGLASGACVGIIVVDNIVGDWTWLWRLNWPIHVFLHVLVVFLVPSILLGTTGPVLAKMALDQGRSTGRTMGGLCAFAAAGSVIGIFLAGFYLIPTFGTATIVWGIGAALLAMAILYWASCWVMYLWGMIFIALITMGMAPADWAQEAGANAMLRTPADPNVIYQKQTAYDRVMVRQTSRRPDRRVLMQDDLTRDEAIFAEETNLQRFQARIWAAVTRGLCKDRQRPSMMVVGAGGYVFPRYFKATWPGSDVEVVELDPGVTEAAVAALGLDENASIRTVHQDARCYVEQLVHEKDGEAGERRFDFIYQDVSDGCGAAPQLMTREFNDKVASLLADDGVYMLSLCDAYEIGRFLGAVVNTVQQTFTHVYVIASETDSSSSHDTFVVVASRQRVELSEILAGHDKYSKFRILGDSEIDHLLEQAGHFVLTDDFAPVEQMLAPVVRQDAVEAFARKCLRDAAVLQANRKYEQSTAKYQQAMRLNPLLTLEACRQIGLMHMAQNQPEQAIKVFQEAIQAGAEATGTPAAAGEVRMHLGILLNRMNKTEQAKEHLSHAAKWFRIELDENPCFVVVWDWLGETLATMGDFKQASDAFARARDLEPANPNRYLKLTRALERQGRYEDAIAVVKEHIRLVREQGNQELANQLDTYLNKLEYNKVKQPR